jgi:chondroitin 4-sulfotransferase 11
MTYNIKKYAILLENYKAIYILVPKAGTSSMKKVCIDLCNISTECKIVHQAPLPYISMLEAQKPKYSSYFKFTFIRDPWDRLVSCYEDKINDKSTSYGGGYFPSFHKYNNITKDMSFKEFVQAVSEIPDKKSNTHFISQYFLLTLGTNNEKQLFPDYIGRLESIEQDFDNIKKVLGVENQTLHHIHRLAVDKSTYRNYYNTKTKQLTYSRYYNDIVKFNYPF